MTPTRFAATRSGALPPTGVVGASARAAVHSLARAGLAAWAVDLFADRDLKRVAACAVCPFPGYPAALPRLAAQFPPGPVLYTGGLENHPHVVAELAAARDLWGNPPAVLERVRDPYAVSEALAAAGFAVPRPVPPGHPCPAAGRWLRKPLRSAAGLGIRFVNPGEAASPHHYFQEFVAGPAMSAIFVNDALFGVTEQLIGEPWLHAGGFAYCGNVGPVEPPPGVADLGRVLVAAFGLTGVWGLDFVLKGGVPYPVEVNPRYTAAVEVLEHGLGRAAFQDPSPEPPPPGGEGELSPPFPGREGGTGGLGSAIAKAIYFAPHPLAFPAAGPWDADLAGDFDPWTVPAFADIPEPGTVSEPGQPVLTMFSDGRDRLQSRAADLDALFSRDPTGSGRSRT